ncbi:MAG: HlyD family efflux transporter periplasmic adaptor subunit [Coriobacteriia bacterium]|nr:HlyD family efflux transporter periplasmic adaptor subunit [Coriobacteriia bacterium]MCL2537734.1 HlyD family efflux transporter periplasmic adaptor subunit [Coriobacteriia bacterium]
MSTDDRVTGAAAAAADKAAEKTAAKVDKAVEKTQAKVDKAVAKTDAKIQKANSKAGKATAKVSGQASAPVKTSRTDLKAANKKKALRKKIIWGVVVAALIAGVVAAFFILQGIGTPVTTAKVESGDVAITVFATGALTAGESVDVYAETQGLIETVEVEEGQAVEEGQVLARLDDAAATAQVAQAEAALEQARAGLAQAQSGSASAGSGTSAAQAALTAAQAGLTSARNMDRLSKQSLSSAEDVVSMMQSAGLNVADPAGFAQAQAAVTQAQMAVEQSTAGIAQARAGVAQAEAALSQARNANPGAAVAAARSGVEAAEAGLDLAQTALESTIIRAPKAGMVLIAPTAVAQATAGTGVTPTGGMTLQQGSAITPGSPVFSIVDENALAFSAEVDEVDIRKIALGQTAIVTLSAITGEEFAATVSSISNTAKPTITGGTVFDIELTFNEALPEARIGMKGDVTVEIETQVGALTIPVDAWFREAGQDFVWIVTSDHTLDKRPIVVGASTESVVEVLSGVEASEVVAIASGAVPFTQGMHVTVNQ